MKKRIYLLASILCCTFVILPSCGNDDPVINDDPGKVDPGKVDPGKKDPEKETTKTITIDASAYDKWVYVNLADGSNLSHEIDPVAGTYSGDLSLAVMGQDQGSVSGLKLEASRVSGDSIKFVLKDFALGKYGKIGDITSGAKVVVDSINGGLGYTLAGGEVMTTLEKYNVKATSKGNIVGKQIELTTTMTLGAMPMPVIATYKGTIENGTIDESSFTWDIAFHRWDVKTNGGAGLETKVTEIESLTDIPTENYTADEEIGTILVDPTNMMQGKVGYATGYVNKTLGKWMNLDTSNMPPTYTMSDKVYVLKTSAGKYVKIKFTDYTNDENKKGYITFKYVYPAK